MPDILDSINAQQGQKQVRTRLRLIQLGHLLDPNSNTDLLPKSALRFPVFNPAKTTTLLKDQSESSVSRNGCPAKGVPLFQWSWPQNGRKPRWKRPPARLPPLSISKEKNDASSQSFLESELKASSIQPEVLQEISSNVNSEQKRPKITPKKSNNKLQTVETTEKEERKDLPEIKRRQLVVVIPYIPYVSNLNESGESVDEDNDAFDNNNNETHEEHSSEHPSNQNKEIDKRLDQDMDNGSGKPIRNTLSKKNPGPSKSNSSGRKRVLMKETIADTEPRSEQYCFSSEIDSSDNEDEIAKKSIVDFSHKVRNQWQKELREILNISPDYYLDRDTAKSKEEPDLPSCAIAAVLPPAAPKENAFSLQNNHRTSYDKFTESAKENDSHLQRLGACYNLALTHQMPLCQEVSTIRKKERNTKLLSELGTKKSTRKHLRHREKSPSESYDFHFFWNLLEASKSQAGAGIKPSPNDSCKDSHCSSSETWAINSPVYKRVFFYKKKLK